MIKIFNILLIISISFNSFSQDYFGNISDSPLKYNGDNSLSENLACYYTWDDNLEGKLKTYMVSYATNEDFKQIKTFDTTIVKGELYVHIWNFFAKKWEICSDVIQTDYIIWTMDYNLHDDQNHLVYNKNKITRSFISKIYKTDNTKNNSDIKSCRIKKLKNGCVVILIENFSPTKEKLFTSYYSIIVLVPDGWKYKSTRFEELDKNVVSKYPYEPKISESGNSFIYELPDDEKTIKLHFTVNEDNTVDLKDNDYYIKNSNFRKL